jgi:chromosome segregation ATPase
VPISSKVEAARIPQQLLGELFVQKGLITPEELAEALAEQKTSDKRIGQILVQLGFVSRPDLATVLAEQLGVELAKQEGFGAGLWSEIKRRHPRGKPDAEENEPPEPVDPPVEQEPLPSAFDEPEVRGEAEPDELESLRQQLAFASTRVEEERSAHQGTQRLLEESRGELASRAQEIDDWRERALRVEDSQEPTEDAAAELAKLEATAAELRAELTARERELEERNASEAHVQSLAEQVEALRVKSDEAWGLLEDARTEAAALDGTVTELRAELEAREGELAAGAEVQSQLAAEAGRLEDELHALRDQHSGSKDAIAALTAQVDELRAGSAEAQRLVDEARGETAALHATVAELRAELDRAREESGQSQTAVTTLTERLDEERASGEELERKLLEARAEAAAFEATAGELREELSSRGDADMLEEQLRAVREELARLERVSEQRKGKVKELQALVEDERARSVAATADLEQELRSSEEERSRLEQLVAERERVLVREVESRTALEAETVELRRQAPKASELEQELSTIREEMGRREQLSEQRKAKVKELQALLENERAQSAAATAVLEQSLRDFQQETSTFEQLVAERDRALAREAEARAAVQSELEALRAEAEELRRELPRAGKLEQELSTLRDELARQERLSQQRKTKLNELRGLLEGEQARSAAATADLEQELRSAQEERSRLEQQVAKRERALAGEAEARAAVEAQLASLGSNAEALDQRLREESASHVATRRELGRVEAELASLQPLTDKLAATETELAACAKLLEEVSAGLDAAKERAERDYDSDRHVVLMPLEGVYALAERPGPTPEVGTYEDVDGARFLVARIGRSPLPADKRRCAYLEVA